MKAAEGGSPVGQLYWGLCLRLGTGIGRDERKGFGELVNACDRILASSAIDLRAAAGTILTPAQLKSMSVSLQDTCLIRDTVLTIVKPDLAIGLFEVANCYLNGVGAKRNIDMALEYLRMASGLGDLAAQEREYIVIPTDGHHHEA
jgi:TPR repeat protein